MSLQDDLETALMDAMQGDHWGSGLKGRLELAARTVLLRHGYRSAKPRAELGPDGVVRVEILLPPGPARVRRLVVSVAGH